MSLSDRTADAVFDAVETWALPIDLGDFLLWLREAIDAPSDTDRARIFMTYPAARYMPKSLQDALGMYLVGPK